MSTLNLATSMGANLLYSIKGDSHSDNIDYTAALDSTVTTVDGFTGRGVCLSSGKWVMGLSTVASLPYILFAGLDPNNFPDVTRTRGMPYSGAAKAVAWSVLAPLEIATTGFLGSDTYTTIGAPLTISANASAAGSKGLYCLQTINTQPICGFVGPLGKYTNEHGYSVLDVVLHYVPGFGTPALRTL